ncbi:hypothetical protein [Bdellovibrio svalbardensis]|uniref:Lipoprotein n=1 Tax=Bdellovibrio svalbardensis TaxID=2972972 RepID=A0ABT6DLY3_9BACT|nr:hypothetical protein [Bdellovibrio svalbardensis]MDG0817656.1 hypothetical protein [Bdellovibrio svalbardensis]
MKNTKRILLSIVPTMVFGLTGCSGGSSSSSSGDALNVSGVLSLGNSAQGLEKVQSFAQLEEAVSAMSVTLSSYKVSCSTNTTPVQTATASVGSDGSFNVSIAGATGQPLTCFLVDSNGNKAADFLISDSSKKDLNGNAETKSTTAFKKDANLGTIDFDPNAGEVTVPASNISSVVAPVTVAAAQVFDPTGAWTIGAVDFSLPNGTKAPCDSNDNTCHGPPSGQAIYLKLWKGSVIADSSDIYGLQVWEGQNSFSTCGSKIGLTPAMKTSLGVDFSANGGADSEFSFASSVANFADQISSQTGTVNLTDGWKMDTAKLQYDMMPNCAPHDVTIAGTTYSNAWVCGPDNSSNYQAQLGGGCSDANGNPVNLNDWSGITCGSTSTSTSGIKTMSCSGNANINGTVKAVTCTNKWAVTDASYAVDANANFNWNDLNASKISSGATCASIANGASSEALKIAQLQCYSQYYYQSGMERANACLPKVDMDWSATTAANFAIVDKIRPQGLIFFEKYSPFVDGTGGSLMTRQEHYEGVNVNGNSWVNCRVIEVGGLNIKKISATKLLATYQSSTITTSLTKPACLAKFNGARESYMFYLNK